MSEMKERNMIFISHAWEDFEFTKWLALQLAKEGFGVWCDLTKLLGGENWPREINEALQRRTCKFLFVLSRSSNTKPDPLGELETARKIMRRENISNFIVPLKIDSIVRDQVDYRLQEIQSLSFESGWAKGLSDLLKMLNEQGIPKNLSFNPQAVNEWWKRYGTESRKILETPENLSSNRFSIHHYPTTIFAHFVDEKPRIISRIIESIPLSTLDIIHGEDELIENSKTGLYYLTRLSNQTFEKGMVNKGLRSFTLAKSKGCCYYFHEELLNNGRIKYRNSGELDPRIKLWGKFGTEKWYWALRVRFMMEPQLHYLVQSHVLVQNKKGFSPAPKGVYKSWRNDKWRDKLKASMVHLAEDNSDIRFGLGANNNLTISKESTLYTCPVSYEEPAEQSEIEDADTDG